MLPFDADKLKTELIPAYENAIDGLPDEVFTYISTVTPLVNVDLLIRNDKGEILLSWRYDYRRSGWHIPGGIIRYKETFEQRIAISLLYECKPVKDIDITAFNKNKGETDNGFLKWFDKCPEVLVYGQRRAYEGYLKELLHNSPK